MVSFAAISVCGQESRNALDFAYSGFLEAEADVLVAGLELGRIESIAVQVGQSVDQGQEIARLEDALQRIAVEHATLLATMTGRLEAAESDVALQTRKAAQLNKMAGSGGVRPEELAKSEIELRLAQANLRSVHEDAEAKQIELRRTQILLERRKIVSPIRGVIVSVLCQPGEFLSPANPSIVRVVSTDRIIAVFNLPTEAAYLLKPQEAVQVNVFSVSKVVGGTVASVAPAINSESGTVEVRVMIDNHDLGFFPGDRCELVAHNGVNPIRQSTAFGPTNR